MDVQQIPQKLIIGDITYEEVQLSDMPQDVRNPQRRNDQNL